MSRSLRQNLYQLWCQYNGRMSLLTINAHDSVWPKYQESLFLWRLFVSLLSARGPQFQIPRIAFFVFWGHSRHCEIEEKKVIFFVFLETQDRPTAVPPNRRVVRRVVTVHTWLRFLYVKILQVKARGKNCVNFNWTILAFPQLLWGDIGTFCRASSKTSFTICLASPPPSTISTLPAQFCVPQLGFRSQRIHLDPPLFILLLATLLPTNLAWKGLWMPKTI